MGLAPYGEPRFEKLIRDHLIDLREDGSYRLDMSYFGYCVGNEMTSPKFHALFGAPPRQAEQAHSWSGAGVLLGRAGADGG
jgi:carbamoyltransferase